MNKHWTKFRRLLREHEYATRIHEMKGSYRPEEWNHIERWYKQSKKNLVHHVRYMSTI